MPFLGYSGRGRSQRGGRRGGRGGRGRGRGGCGHGRGGGAFRATKKHRWVRPITREINIVVNDDHDDVRKPKTASKNIGNNSTTTATTAIEVSGSNSSNNTEDLTASKYVIMKKNGHNQLILSSKTRSVAVAASTTARLSDESQPITSRTLTREGNHKLISTSNKNKTKPTIVPKRKQPINHSNNSYPESFRYQKSNGGGGGGGVKYNTNLKSSSTSCCPVAKRVKLPPSSTNTDGNIGNEKNNKDPSDIGKIKDLDVELKSQPDDNKDSVRPKRTGKLTDFAYRETSRVRQRAAVTTSHNLHWSKKKNESSNTSDVTCSTGSNNSKAANKQSTTNNKRKNMGLVRIQPNEENTPICSAFLRGIQCQNQYCRKRHDAPKEYAVPICSFFQRHGQCMKGESCVFRHIRNPICSYCQKRHDPSKEFCSYFTKI